MSSLFEVSWIPQSGVPYATSTTLTSIHTSEYPHFIASLTGAINGIETATDISNLISLSSVIRSSEESFGIVSANIVLATATDDNVQVSATNAILKASGNTDELTTEMNLYIYRLSFGGNVFYLVFFALLLLFYSIVALRSTYCWFNVCFVCGFLLESIGFLGRVLGIHNRSNATESILQSVCLTIASAFIMAGICFVFAQLVAIHGQRYSVLSPMWYTYSFVSLDFLSLLVQAAGCGLSAVGARSQKYVDIGDVLMLSGVILQLVEMSAFIGFLFEFLVRIYFLDRHRVQSDSPYTKKTFVNFFKMLLNVSSAKEYKQNYLETFYNPRHQGIRSRPLFPYYAMAVTAGVVVIYIRCLYRVAELQQGYSGFLMNHEVFLLTLDSALLAICGLFFIPFHPLFVFGRENVLSVLNIQQELDFTGSQKEYPTSIRRQTHDYDEDESFHSVETAIPNQTLRTIYML